MHVALAPICFPGGLSCTVAFGCLLGTRVAVAFPAADASHPSIVTSTPEPTESDLRHQLQMQSGFAAAAAGGNGWTILPSIGAQEAYTDNVLNTDTNRRWDLITVATPGISVFGDVPNAQVRLSYAPQFRLDARTPSENSITNRLIGTASITLIPDAAYLDVRAFAGSSPTFGGFGGVGLGTAPLFNSTEFGGIGTAGLAKRNLTQTSSFSASPYVLHRFGDIGTAKLGYSYSQTASANNGSYLPLFFLSKSTAQYVVTNQGVAQFETGERFAPFRDLVLANVTQGTGTGVNRDSAQDFVSNTLGYAVTRQVSVYGELGYENLRFGGTPQTRIDDAIWGIGTTLTPNPDSQITIGYGHKNGVTGVQLHAYYAITARTSVSASYTTGLQSDLQQLQSQLNLADLNSSGGIVESQTGAPLFLGSNPLGFSSGLFRTKNLTATGSTILDRDQISVSIQLTQQTTVAVAPPGTLDSSVPAPPPVGQTSQGGTAFASWIHQFSESLSLSSGVAYGVSNASATGRERSIGAAATLQYLLSDTLATYARYAYFDRTSPTASQSFYQNLVLVGINKQF